MSDTAEPAKVFDLAIVGAGPAGGTLAIVAAQAGLSVALIDARDPAAEPARDTRNFAIVRGSWRMLAAAGITGALGGEGVQPLNGLEATDGGQHWFGAPSVLFETADLPATPDGTPLGYMVEAAPLQAAIDRVRAKTGGITLIAPARFAGLSQAPGAALVRLEDGQELRALLVAGCDGVNSPVRNALGIGTEGRSYGKSVFAANVRLSRPHQGIARQLFTPEGPFATLPLTGDRANLAWYMKQGAAEALADRPAHEIEAELNARFADFAGEMRLDGPHIAYPLKLQIARDMIGPRAALVGDAAHRINPLAGQGLNLGFKDVAALAEIAVEAVRTGLDPGAEIALERYRAWRRFDCTATALAMDAIDRVYSNDSALLKPVRGLALSAAGLLAPVRRAMARQASADQDGLPRLLRGEAL